MDLPSRSQLISTLRACIAPHVALETTLGPPSTTQRPLSNTLRACITPNVAFKGNKNMRQFGVAHEI